MKYGDLPSVELYRKLLNVSFRSPRKNLAVHLYLKSILPLMEYVENERVKLVRKWCIPTDKAEITGLYTVTPEFTKRFNEVLDMEIEPEIKRLHLNPDDFSDEECSYSDDKKMWLSAAELEKVLAL